MSMAVHLNRSPHSVRLVAWGRAGGGWWACITGRVRVRAPAGAQELDFAAWVPGDAVSLPGWSSPVAVVRIALPAERPQWPPPRGWPAWYAGVWSEGPLPMPAGLAPVTGPAWRPDSSTR
jgi:hypothetical protein